MRIELNYHKEGLEVEIPDENLMQILKMKQTEPLADAKADVSDALEGPTGSPPLVELARGRKNACVVISDITRPVPNKDILPPLLDTLESAGLSRDAITILIATGLHRPNEGEELAEMVGEEVMKSYRFVNHVARDLESHKYLGETELGTPAYVDRRYVEADLKITTGLIEPHLMAGYSGGRKSILPGIAAVETVRAWHSPKLLESPNAAPGNMKDNPVHEESLRIAKMAGVDFTVNAVMNEKRKTIGIFAGDLEASFQKGVELIDDIVKVEMPKLADIVVTTSAGYPLDTTFYQAAKGLVGALSAVKKGGTIIMAAGLRDGMGSPDFVRLVRETKSLDDFMHKILHEGYFAVDQWQLEEMARVVRRAEPMVYSDGLSKDDLRAMFVTPVDSVERGIERSLEKHGRDAAIAVIPEGPYVIPYVRME